MTLVGTSRWISPEEYLTSEPHWDRRREYVNGAAFDVADRDSLHDRIVENLAKALASPAEQRKGRVYAGGVKLRVETTNAYYYPDLLFSCEESGVGAVAYAPELLVEVAAANTAGVDQREKLGAYLTIPWLKEYLIVDIEQRQVDVWRRTPSGWRCEMYGDRGAFKLESLSADLTIEQLFG